MEKRHFQKVVLRMKLFLSLVFHLPYSKYKGVKICFYSCRYQNQNFSLVSHSYRTRVVSVALVSHLCRTPVAGVSLVLLVSHSCCIHVACVALVSLVSGTRIVNQIRSLQYTCYPVNIAKYLFKSAYIIERLQTGASELQGTFNMDYMLTQLV